MCLIGMFYGAYSIDFELRKGVQIGYKVFVGLITVILVYLRQEVAMINMQESRSRYESNSAEITRYKQRWIVDDETACYVSYCACVVVLFGVLWIFFKKKKKEKSG